MGDDIYMKDDRAKSMEGFIAALQIFAKYDERGLKAKGFMQAEHDELFIYIETEKLPEDSEDGIALQRLGFHVSEGGWAMFT